MSEKDERPKSCPMSLRYAHCDRERCAWWVSHWSGPDLDIDKGRCAIAYIGIFAHQSEDTGLWIAEP